MNRRQRTVWSAIIIVPSLVATMRVADAQLSLSNAPNHSTAVPSHFVSAPGGLTDPQCIHEIPDGESVSELADGSWDVLRAGSVVAHYPACSSKPVAVQAFGAVGPGSYSGWVEDSQQNAPSGQTFDGVNADWVVPSKPTQNGATLYYFPGLQSNTQGNCGIIQPVLQWGVSPAGGGNFWTIGSWWWGNTNQGHSTLKTVSPGDQLDSFMQYSGTTWTIDLRDETSGADASFSATTACQFNWAGPAVLEVDMGFPVTNCNQFARDVVNINGIFLDIGFPSYNNVTFSPSPNYPIGANTLGCGFGVGSSYSELPGPSNSSTLWSSELWSTGEAVSIPSTSPNCGTLGSGDAIVEGEYVQSCDGRFVLSLQTDGNLVLYGPGPSVLWATGTASNPGAADLIMQSDGNLALRNKNGTVFQNVGAYGAGQTSQYAPAGKLTSGTNGHSGDHMIVQNDGNVLVLSTSGSPLWATNTCCH